MLQTNTCWEAEHVLDHRGETSDWEQDQVRDLIRHKHQKWPLGCFLFLPLLRTSCFSLQTSAQWINWRGFNSDTRLAVSDVGTKRWTDYLWSDRTLLIGQDVLMSQVLDAAKRLWIKVSVKLISRHHRKKELSWWFLFSDVYVSDSRAFWLVTI